MRPVSVRIGLLGTPVSREQRIYYLMYAINQGLPRPMAEEIIALTLTVVAVSIVLHGISVTPLMNLYGRRKARRSGR
ncbi:MAG: Na+/H+ antiporter [bacterium]|nr:MAG: Na+/H+ antiporter [bacterium]